MNCPVCNEPMVVIELEQVETDYCTNCGGIWLDSGELELLIENLHEREQILNSFSEDLSTREKSHPCPICGKKMGKVIVRDKNKVLIDKCKKEHGFWFDKGELNSVIENASDNKQNKVLNLLKDMFENRVTSNNNGED